jgi:hypothetical protein
MATSVAAGEVVSAEVGFLPATFDEGVHGPSEAGAACVLNFLTCVFIIVFVLIDESFPNHDFLG